MLRDALCIGVTMTNRNMVVPWFLMASYAYYQVDSPILSDGVFDRYIRQRVINEYDNLRHWHKLYVPRHGHGFVLPATAYPRRVIAATNYLIKHG